MTTRPMRSLSRGYAPWRGYTLIEILVALTLTLMLMSVVVRVFGGVGDGIRKSRSALEQFDRERSAALQLKMDLSNITARPDGRSARPEEAPGYLEIVEGSYQFVNNGSSPPYYGLNDTGGPDYTVGERGDMIMFTARNPARPYVGRYMGSTTQSDVAEVCWFLRGNRLHRRVLLVLPGASALVGYSKGSFYSDNDISAHIAGGKVVPNSLADLTKRENRYGHDARQYPFDVRGWGGYGLPTLAECSSAGWLGGWQNGSTPPPQAGPAGAADMWDNSPSGVSNSTLSDQAISQGGTRIADDVILNNVIEFDIKVWEPAANGGAGGYIDLGLTTNGTQASTIALNSFTMPQGPTFPRFTNAGIKESGLTNIYDTGCFSYENEGIYHMDGSGNPQIDTPGGHYTNGFDDDGDGVVDDMSERISTLPYPVALRGIQIKIRCFEPDSRQIREITIENDFLPK